jgi:hypothetical protein
MDSPLLNQAIVLSDAVGALSSLGFDHTPLPEMTADRILHWLVPREKCVCNLQNNNPTETRKRGKWPHVEHIARPAGRLEKGRCSVRQRVAAPPEAIRGPGQRRT